MKKINLVLFTALTSVGSFFFSNAFADNNIESQIRDNIDDGSLALSSDSNLAENIGNLGGTSYTIDGSGSYSISGSLISNPDTKFSGIITADGQTLNLNNILTINNFSGTDGSVINNAGNFNSQNTSFSENGGLSVNGGVIYNTGITNLVDTDLNSNQSLNGAIYNLGSLTISATPDQVSTLSGNTAAENGGAIYNAGIANLSNNEIQSNKAINGGAIYNEKTLNVSDSKFMDNIASQDGGAIYNTSEGDITLSNVLLSTNVAENGNGGAIYNDRGTMNIDNGTFENNTANSGSGGAIHNASNGNKSSWLNNNKFSSNTATDGGAIYNSGMLYVNKTDSAASADTNIFSNNSASNNGGAVYNTDVADLNGQVFELNVASNNGGAIYNIGNVNFKESTFNQNGILHDEFDGDTITTKNGGAIYNTHGLTVADSEFTNNSATTEGGAIYNTGTATFENTNFSANGHNMISGGAIHNEGTMNLTNGEYRGNIAQIGGFAMNSGTLTIRSSNGTDINTSGNNADNNGGAFYNTGTLNLTGLYLQANQGAEGGAIYSTNLLTIDQAKFNDNTGRQGGAAIYNSGQGSVSNSEFHANAATGGDGGAINNSGMFTITNTVFTENTSSLSSGGAIYNTAHTDDTLTISNSSFNTNSTHGSSNSNGGAIANTGNLVVADTTFNDNIASNNGGAIHNIGDAKISDSTFTGNGIMADPFDPADDTLSVNGGAIYNTGTLDITNTSFLNNQASENGGAIWSSTDINITANNGSSTFQGNGIKGADLNPRSNAIYMASADANLNLNIKNNGNISFQDDIDGLAGYGINITGDSKDSTASGLSGVTINSTVNNVGTIKVANSNLILDTNSNIDGAALNLDNSSLNLKNNTNQNLELQDFTAQNGSSIAFDANLATGESDQINATTASGTLSIDAINITGDGKSDINIFNNASGIIFDNLDSFKAYNGENAYSFTAENGKLSVKDQEQSDGLNSAVGGSETTKSYTVGDSANVNGDLGALGGGEGAQLTILGNDKILSGAKTDGSGEGYAGISVDNNQTLNVQDVASVEGFHSANGGFTNSSGTINISNSSFKNNQADLNGGAIWSDSNVNISSDNGGTVDFSGNTANGASNAIYMADAGSSLNLNASQNSSIEFNDGINGVNGYTINVNGDETGKITLNEAVENAGTFNINGSRLYVAQDNFINGSSVNLNGGELHFDNNLSNQNISLATLTGGRGIMHIDVDSYNSTSDVLDINTLNGTVNIIGHLYNSAPITYALADPTTPQENSDEMIFANVQNNNGDFNILRVDGSSFAWDARYDEASKAWSMFVERSGGSNPIVTAETIAYLGLNSAGLEQTRGMIRNIEAKTASNELYVGCCGGYYDKRYNAQPLYNFWVSPVYNSAQVDSPVKFDADITGLEAGGDIQLDPYNRVGVFASYRQGKYDFNGKSEYYDSKVSSDLDIDSYIGGLYYRYTNQTFWTLATVFGGTQSADIKTKDGISSSTDGTEFGGSFGAGYGIPINRSFIIEPTVRASYTQISYDDIKDDFNKEAKFDDASQTELEAGVKFEKTIYNHGNYAKFYVKPSVIQTFTTGDKVKITNLNTVHTLENQTLGRGEIGFSGDVAKDVNIYGSAAYTFGSDYKDTSFNFGLNYAF